MPENVYSEAVAQMPATAKRGLKQPGQALSRTINRVNLVSKDDVLPEKLVPNDLDVRRAQGRPLFPTIDELEEAIAGLPEKLAAYLMESLHDNKWALASESSANVQRLIGLYNQIRSDREALYRSIQLIQEKEISYLRECRMCHRIFFAVRENQWYWPAECAKKQRNQKWQKAYREKYGHSYRAKTREPRHVAKVREVLEKWKDFKSTLENKKDLAADADVTLTQCEDALDYIERNSKTKRADPARKRR